MALNIGAKFEVVRFNETRFFRLRQRQVKDMLAQQGLSKFFEFKIITLYKAPKPFGRAKNQRTYEDLSCGV
ncbi:hypothetical protein Lal_00042204 [Lupinus albus]|nr:hypothetical protein Lal_00042204 [Lupinus albus]